MQLPVLKSPEASEPWFADGLKFTCNQCGNCCSGGPGYVGVTGREIEIMAVFLGISQKSVIRKYCRKVGSQYSLKEVKHPVHGGYDCIFIKEIAGVDAKKPKRICSVYEARPLQCRTWPFWEGNLASAKAWERASKSCLGMNHGEKFTRLRIEKLRDAEVRPENPPTSGK